LGKKIRKQIYLEPRHGRLLKQLAEYRGVSEAELIRQAVDRQWSSGIGQPLARDPAAWEEAREFMLSLRSRGPVGVDRKRWTREESLRRSA